MQEVTLTIGSLQTSHSLEKPFVQIKCENQKFQTQICREKPVEWNYQFTIRINENSEILYELFDGDELKSQAKGNLHDKLLHMENVGELSVSFQIPQQSPKRPDGVEKNPLTNKNVKGRRKKASIDKKAKQNKFVPDSMIKQFHRDMSQSSIQKLNVSPPMLEEYPTSNNLEKSGILNITLNNTSHEAIKAIMNEGPLRKKANHYKRGSLDTYQNVSSKILGKTPSKKNMASTFSIYGGTSSQSPDWSKMANIMKMNPTEAANKYYDKNVARALDKFTSQEKHLEKLQLYKDEIAKLKKGGPSTTFLRKDGSVTSVRFNVDEKTEVKKMIYLNNHLNHRSFQLNEKMMNIYQNNLQLQNRIDEIQLKGSNYDQKKLKSQNYNKTPQSSNKGSLNYNIKKREAIRIDQENLKMAKRIVGSKPVLNKKEFDKEYQKYAKTKAFLVKDKSLEIGSIVNSQRQRFSKIEANSILFPEINTKKFNSNLTISEEAQDIDQYAAMGKAVKMKLSPTARSSESEKSMFKTVKISPKFQLPNQIKIGMRMNETLTQRGPKKSPFQSKEHKIRMAHKESLRQVMNDPEMQQLSETWMGAFYTNPPKLKKKSPEMSKKQSMVKINKQIKNRKSKIKFEEIPEILTGGPSANEEKILHKDVSQDFIEKINMNQTMSNFSQD